MMANLFNKLAGRQPASRASLSPGDEDADLLQFFTDCEAAIKIFEDLVSGSNLSKRLMVIHGVGGTGKSSLLKVFRHYCRQHKIPTALARGEDTLSPASILADWADGLKAYGINLPTFEKSLKQYRALQNKVAAEAEKLNREKGKAPEAMGKIAFRTATGVAASMVPVVGPLVKAAGDVGTELLMEKLRGVLPRSDLEFFLDPTHQLNQEFLADLRAIHTPRIVLMIDTFEQIAMFGSWLCNLARLLPPAVLLVVAGRGVPAWDRDWQGWIGSAELVEQVEMAPEEIRLLVQRYYAHIHGGQPDPAQVEKIVEFARGLPVVATTVVRLWVEYSAQTADFQAVRPKVVADLVERVLEDVNPALRPAFEVAAALRFFNVETLQVLLVGEDSEAIYAELERWPCVRPRREGLPVQASMRDMLNEALRVRAPQRFHLLHEKAAIYYDTQLGEASGDEARRLELERLYHRIKADEETGLHLFQEMAETLARFHMSHRLRLLLNDVNSYDLELENSRLWVEYYRGRLAYLESRIADAERIYQVVADSSLAESRLRAYALFDWSIILTTRERLSQPGGVEKAFDVLERSQRLAPKMDAKLISILSRQRYVHTFLSEWEQGITLLERQRRWLEENGDVYGVIDVNISLLSIYVGIGDWKQALSLRDRLMHDLDLLPENQLLKARLTGRHPWAVLWSGRYHQGETGIREYLAYALQMEDLDSQADAQAYLAYALGLQGKYDEAGQFFTASLNLIDKIGADFTSKRGVAYGLEGAILTRQGELRRAKELLDLGLQSKLDLQDNLGIPELLVWQGELSEVNGDLEAARDYYGRHLDGYRKIGRKNFDCAALTGLARVEFARGKHKAVRKLWAEAEALAQIYEYNDYLAWLYLLRGYAIMEDAVPGWDKDFQAALSSFQLALIYALRYNRFLLDAILSGGITTPMPPLVPFLRDKGKKGHKYLEALRKGWQNGKNEIKSSRHGTVSVLPESIPLKEAEHIARQNEPGNGYPQKTVLEQLSVEV
jgi:tetratricopeptide (TPR) repeat protein